LKKEFVYKQKINLELADIVVINHSLLFSDLKNDFSFFGKVENLVIDEAHSIEDIATESLKNSFSIKVLEDMLSYIEAVLKYNYIDITSIQTQKVDLLSNIKLFFDIFHSYLKEKTNNEHFFINSLLDD
jgi:ATP-dependent DNA helicase DinG